MPSRCSTTLEASTGRGFAAPQIGVAQRVFVLRVEGVTLCAVNPVLEDLSTDHDDAEEGCLSVPGFLHSVRRSSSLVLHAHEPDGTPLRLALQGPLARATQHEVDHLDGLLYLDRLPHADRQPYEEQVRRSAWTSSESLRPDDAYRALWGR